MKAFIFWVKIHCGGLWAACSLTRESQINIFLVALVELVTVFSVSPQYSAGHTSSSSSSSNSNDNNITISNKQLVIMVC